MNLSMKLFLFKHDSNPIFMLYNNVMQELVLFVPTMHVMKVGYKTFKIKQLE